MDVNIHASCVVLARAGAVFDAPAEAGVLLVGRSGTGKSDLALRLIASGAELVADDRAVLTADAGALIASAPPALAGLIEVRNLGIVALPCWPAAKIALVAELAPGETPARMPEPERWRPPPELGLPTTSWPPLIRLDPFEASAPVKLAVAAAAFARNLLRGAVAGS
jgi:serine kinase of HPr protein (carbohydrate metabolism regulator)